MQVWNLNKCSNVVKSGFMVDTENSNKYCRWVTCINLIICKYAWHECSFVLKQFSDDQDCHNRREKQLLNNYRAMLCISVVFAVAWCPSVRPSVTLVDCIQTSKVIVKLLSRASSAIILVFWPSADTQFQGESLQWGCKIQGDGNFCDFRLKSQSISEMVWDRPTVTMEH